MICRRCLRMRDRASGILYRGKTFYCAPCATECFKHGVLTLKMKEKTT